jgi:hypothetical protein
MAWAKNGGARHGATSQAGMATLSSALAAARNGEMAIVASKVA